MDIKIPLPFQVRSVLVDELKKNDLIVKSEELEMDSVDIIYRVIRVNKKTITVQGCDEFGTICRDKKVKMIKQTYPYRVVNHSD